jgi:hypothetical protein
MGLGGQFRINLPTTSDFIVFVTAPGYSALVLQ